MKRKHLLPAPRPGRRPGFSLIELMVVIGVIAVMAMMAVPAILSMLPYLQVRAEARNVSAVMQQARLKAASTQKPTRVIVDCSAHLVVKDPPCRISMQTAVYEGGEVTGWRPVAESLREMSPRVAAERVETSGPGDGAGKNEEGVPIDKSAFWVIFMPSSRTFSDPRPFAIRFVSESFNRDAHRAAWLLSVNANSGRTTLTRP